MKFFLFLLSFLLIFLLWKIRQPRFSGTATSIQEIEAYIDKLLAKNKPPGLSVVVVKDGRVAYNRAFGWADSPAGLAAAPDTVYHWWSMTKIPTAVAILQLWEVNKLDLDDSVSDYLPFFQVELDGKPSAPVTIRQLLRHTSGLQDTIPAMIGWVHYQDEIYPQTELLKQHFPQYRQLKFAPDSKAAYSNLGYMALGAVIESITGMRYEDYVQDNLLTPLGMVHTGFLYTPEMAGTIAAGSHPVVSMYTPLLPFLVDMKKLVRERQGTQYWFNPVYTDVTPSSGLIGSAMDAAVLAQALLAQTEILNSTSHSLLLPQGLTPAERPLGWAEYNISDRVWVQHSGGGPGFATVMRLYPMENLGIVIMANNTDLPRGDLVDAYAGLDW